MADFSIIKKEDIQARIHTIRNSKVMLDSDLAVLYRVKLKRLNEQVKRNIDRFPDNFMFQLSRDESDFLRSQFVTSNDDTLKSQIATSNKRGGRRYLPYVFNEQGVAMLSAVLRSDTAVKISIQIMNAFVEMRNFISNNAEVFNRLDKIERKQLEGDEKFDKLFSALESGKLKQDKGIFFDGQIFDAYTFVADIIRSANTSIKIIDNYIDDTVFTLLSKKNDNVKVSIYTKRITEQLRLDADRFNQQYPTLELIEFNKSHDRFIIIDDSTVYHIGASLKDLGKKVFGFSKMDTESVNILDMLGDNND